MTIRIQYICVAPLHCELRDDASEVQLYWKT